MTNTNETIADIIAEMRALSNPISDGIIAINGRSIADRLEAAHRREKAAIEADALAVGGTVEALRATAEKSSIVGNSVKLREAVKCLMDNLNIHLMQPSEQITVNHAELDGMVMVCEGALAAPPRNCDVGTAEEQARRMDAEYCYVQKSCYESPSGRECPLHKAGVDCRLIWAQMPYKKEE